MKPTIEMLFTDDRFTQLEVLPYEEMIPFIQRAFTYPSLLTRMYIALNILLLLILIVLGFLQVSSGKISFGQLLYMFGLGLAATLTLLVPVHEAIHGLAYKLVGAPKVSFGGNIRQFYFYAVADQFVIGRKAFQLVAMAPFGVISLLVIVSLFFVTLSVQWVLWGILLMHTGACAGDFGMLAFYQRFPGGELYTFDDVAAKKAYFFQKREH